MSKGSNDNGHLSQNGDQLPTQGWSCVKYLFRQHPCRFSSNLSPHRLSRTARLAQEGRQLRSDALFQGRSHSPVLELEHNVLSLRSSLPNSLLSPRNSSRYQRRTSASFKDAVLPVSTNTFVLNILRSWACRYL